MATFESVGTMHITATLPLWVALASAASAQSIPTKVYNASAGTTDLPNSDFSNEQLEFLWNQVSGKHPVQGSLT